MKNLIIIILMFVSSILTAQRSEVLLTNLRIDRDSFVTDNLESINFVITIDKKAGYISFDSEENSMDMNVSIDKTYPIDVHHTETAVVEVLKSNNGMLITMLYTHDGKLLTLGIQTAPQVMSYFTWNKELSDSLRKTTKRI